MAIRINPWALALLLVIICNIFFSLGENRFIRRLYLTISSLLALGGLVGSLITRTVLVGRLEKRTYLKTEFVNRVLYKYDTFALWSGIFTVVVLLLLVALVVVKRKAFPPGFRSGITASCVLSMMGLLFGSVFYGFTTINKSFDIASYIGTLAFCECMLLYIPLIAKRIIPALAKRRPGP